MVIKNGGSGMAWKTVMGLAACAALVGLAAGAAAAQDAGAGADGPYSQTVILAISERPAETPDDYVRHMDETLAEAATWSGLEAPDSVRGDLLEAIAATVPPVLPARREDFVILSFAVSVGRFGQPGVADDSSLAEQEPGGSVQDEARCRSSNPDRTFVAFRKIQVGDREGYQCVRAGRFGDSRQLFSIAGIDMDDRRIVTGGHFASMGTASEVARVFAASEEEALRLFDAQVEAVFVRLTRPSER